MLLASGCSLLSEAEPEPVYIPPEYAAIMKNNSRSKGKKTLGMQQEWTKANRLKQYDKIQITVIVSPKQLETSWWARQNIRSLVYSKEEDLKYIADYTRDSFANAFQQSHHFQLTRQTDPKTLLLEFAIVQVVPNNAVLNAATTIGSLPPFNVIKVPTFFLKGKIRADEGNVAMEAIIRDANTKEILSVFAEHGKGKSAMLFDAKEFATYANARSMIDQWTADVVLVLDQIKEDKPTQRKSQDDLTLIDY